MNPLQQLASRHRRGRQYRYGLLGIFILLALWQGVWLAQLFPAMFLPGPLAVAARAQQLFIDGSLSRDLGVSILRVTAGFLLAVLAAVPFGVLMGVTTRGQYLLAPLFSFIRYMPATAFIPLLVLWMGIGEGQKLAVIFIGAYFHLTLMVAGCLREVPKEFKESAAILGATRGQRLLRVILPAALPAIWEKMRITLGWAWTYIVVAEMVAAQSGIGFAILRASRYMDITTLFAGVIAIGVVGIISDALFVLGGRLLFPYVPSAQEATR
ncbi:ABC transporter permease [Pantoea coffeiphila]|uniref:Nitrate transport permease nrtB n=1 Tax=Pantoea coffeiphila TaxID=1465635 RepID=A0A2S9IBT3_9GAMM|nr:ABC transporter permease [Pantoea coffeiphila]PRD15261.1 nitrate transport permease nrtB [Pantoea coffeiphila]